MPRPDWSVVDITLFLCFWSCFRFSFSCLTRSLTISCFFFFCLELAVIDVEVKSSGPWRSRSLISHLCFKISAQQTKMWNREINDLLRLDSELFTSTSMTASSRQKKKKQLIVKLRVRQNQEQNQDQKQRNNVISTTGQSGRGMRIRRAPKRSY